MIQDLGDHTVSIYHMQPKKGTENITFFQNSIPVDPDQLASVSHPHNKSTCQ